MNKIIFDGSVLGAAPLCTLHEALNKNITFQYNLQNYPTKLLISSLWNMTFTTVTYVRDLL